MADELGVSHLPVIPKAEEPAFPISGLNLPNTSKPLEVDKKPYPLIPKRVAALCGNFINRIGREKEIGVFGEPLLLTNESLIHLVDALGLGNLRMSVFHSDRDHHER